MLRDVLLATVGLTFVLHLVLWDSLEAAVADALLRGHGAALESLALTPFDLLAFQASVGLVVGLLVGSARSWTYYWDRRRRQSRLRYPWRTVSPVVGFLAVGVLVFATAILGSFLVALSVLRDPSVTAELLPAGFQHLRVVQVTMLVVWFGLAVGIGSLVAYVLPVFAIEDVASLDVLALAGATGTVIAAGVGVVLRSGPAYPDLVWTGPILAGYALGLLLAVIAGRRRGATD